MTIKYLVRVLLYSAIITITKVDRSMASNWTEWDCSSSTAEGIFKRSSSCSISGGDHVAVTGVLEIRGSSVDVDNLVTITAAANKRHFSVYGSNANLTLRHLKLVGGRGIGSGYGDGGSIQATASTVLNLFNSIFSGNIGYDGGALYLGSTSDVTATVYMYKVNLTNNTATDDGGAIYVANTNFSMYDSYISQNKAPYGSGIQLSYKTTGLIQNTYISNNVAENEGAGLRMYGGDDPGDHPNVTVIQSFIHNNQVSGGGGAGVYMSHTSKISIHETSFKSNNASSNKGHHIFSYGLGTKIPTLSIVNTYFDNQYPHSENFHGDGIWETCSSAPCTEEPFTGTCNGRTPSKLGVFCGYSASLLSTSCPGEYVIHVNATLPVPSRIPKCCSGPICSNTCKHANDGVCDDGGTGSQYSVCGYGTDCTDCGCRSERPTTTTTTTAPSTTTTTVCSGICSNTCEHANDGTCDDGGKGSIYKLCREGTDCTYCGCRPDTTGAVSGSTSEAFLSKPTIVVTGLFLYIYYF